MRAPSRRSGARERFLPGLLELQRVTREGAPPRAAFCVQLESMSVRGSTMTYLRPLAAAFCAALTVASAPLFGQTAIPNTPAGRVLRAWLDAYNSGDSARVAKFFRTYSVEDALRGAFGFRKMTGGLDLLSVQASEPRHVEFMTRFRLRPMVGYGALDVSAADTSHVSGYLFPLGMNVSVDDIRIDAPTRERVVGRLAALLDSFYVSPEVGKRMSDSLHARLIDLGESAGGGKAGSTPLLESYLFDRRTHLSDVRFRYTGETRERWTLDSVAGARFGGEKPVYVLTSAHTLSAGEELAYDLQALKRATIVGETTSGQAHATFEARIENHFGILLPTGKTLNPVTGADWEGVGVVPDVKVPASDALSTAQRLLREKVAH